MFLWPRLRKVRSRGQKRCGIPPGPVDSGVPSRLGALGTPVGYTDCLARPLVEPRPVAAPVGREVSGALVALDGQKLRWRDRDCPQLEPLWCQVLPTMGRRPLNYPGNPLR